MSESDYESVDLSEIEQEAQQEKEAGVAERAAGKMMVDLASTKVTSSGKVMSMAERMRAKKKADSGKAKQAPFENNAKTSVPSAVARRAPAKNSPAKGARRTQKVAGDNGGEGEDAVLPEGGHGAKPVGKHTESNGGAISGFAQSRVAEVQKKPSSVEEKRRAAEEKRRAAQERKREKKRIADEKKAADAKKAEEKMNEALEKEKLKLERAPKAAEVKASKAPAMVAKATKAARVSTDSAAAEKLEGSPQANVVLAKTIHPKVGTGTKVLGKTHVAATSAQVGEHEVNQVQQRTSAKAREISGVAESSGSSSDSSSDSGSGSSSLSDSEPERSDKDPARPPKQSLVTVGAEERKKGALKEAKQVNSSSKGVHGAPVKGPVDTPAAVREVKPKHAEEVTVGANGYAIAGKSPPLQLKRKRVVQNLPPAASRVTVSHVAPHVESNDKDVVDAAAKQSKRKTTVPTSLQPAAKQRRVQPLMNVMDVEQAEPKHLLVAQLQRLHLLHVAAQEQAMDEFVLLADASPAPMATHSAIGQAASLLTDSERVGWESEMRRSKLNAAKWELRQAQNTALQKFIESISTAMPNVNRTSVLFGLDEREPSIAAASGSAVPHAVFKRSVQSPHAPKLLSPKRAKSGGSAPDHRHNPPAAVNGKIATDGDNNEKILATPGDMRKPPKESTLKMKMPELRKFVGTDYSDEDDIRVRAILKICRTPNSLEELRARISIAIKALTNKVRILESTGKLVILNEEHPDGSAVARFRTV